MKVELFVAAVLTSFSIGERHQRSTVLTDESKRILEHFDFSNFDKQEALNYIDRQRYENQIRGKRSQLRLRKDHEANNGKVKDLTSSKTHPFTESHLLSKSHLKHRRLPEKFKSKIHYSEPFNIKNEKAKAFDLKNSRKKRGRNYGRKHKPKIRNYQEWDEPGDYYNIEDRERKRKRKKKKRHYWDKWTEWSPCSVTCGRGRKIRWRKCIAKTCAAGEFEMGEKTCQLPACNLLTKLFGLK